MNLPSAFLLILLWTVPALAAPIRGRVTDRDTGEPLPGATILVTGTDRGALADTLGRFALTDLAPGAYDLRISMMGYAPDTRTVALTALDTLFLDIALEPAVLEEEEVVVTGTRTARHIDDVPVRIEAIPQEEVEEKLLMTPSSTAMLLNESTGMRVQTTSSGSGALNLRIQGLSGRYTQILLDGIPNFSGLGAGFTLTQLAPLNLRQVEVVKGASSALYGADAIAGVVNFLTKEPSETPEFTALINGTTQRGADAAVYYGQRTGRIGWTLMASANRQPRVDVDGDDYADVPGYEKLTITPKFTAYPTDSLRLMTTFSVLHEDRTGGLVRSARAVIAVGTPYRESVRSMRVDGAFSATWNLSSRQTLAFKAAGARLTRDARYGTSPLDANQTTLYVEGQYTKEWPSHTLVAGAAWYGERLTDHTPGIGGARSYRFRVPGGFLQDEWRLSDVWRLLVSGRLDRHNRHGAFFTPRASIMVRPAETVTIRLGGGTGFKAPTVFVEESEERGFRNVRPLGNVAAETARSASWDINWKTGIGDVFVTLNTALYFTWLDHALIADPDSIASDILVYRNATGRTFTRGGESAVKLAFSDFKVSLGYTYTYATQTDRGSRYELPLNPRHAFGAVLFWENEEFGGKLGIENYWTGSQRLDDHPTRSRSPVYGIVGIIGEKAWGRLRFFINGENLTDTRQTRYEPIITGNPHSGPVRALPIYAPLEGRVVNGGIRVVW